MIGNFRIVSGSVIPWLEVVLTKDGIVPIYSQAPAYGCAEGGTITDPNLVDLEKATTIQFQLFKCGRTPVQVATQGIAEKVQTSVTEGSGETAVTKIVDMGKVRYKWHPDDTSVPGLYYGRFIVTFDDGSVFKWPYQLESLAIEIVK